MDSESSLNIGENVSFLVFVNKTVFYIFKETTQFCNLYTVFSVKRINTLKLRSINPNLIKYLKALFSLT